MADKVLNFKVQEEGQFKGKIVAFVDVNGKFVLHVEKGIGTVKLYFRTMGTNYIHKYTYYTTVQGIDEDVNVLCGKQVAIVCDAMPSEGLLRDLTI